MTPAARAIDPFPAVCLVPGTFGTIDPSASWWKPGSPFAAYLATQGVGLVGRDRPFVWSTVVDGLVGDHPVWKAAGAALYDYLVPAIAPEAAIPATQVRLVAHSHALQVVLYAAAAGLQIQSLVSVCSPVRADMRDVAAQARPRIRHWLHLYTDSSDWWQLAGMVGDRRDLSIRQDPLADRNDCVPGVGHSGLLCDPRDFPLWQSRGWLDVLTKED